MIRQLHDFNETTVSGQISKPWKIRHQQKQHPFDDIKEASNRLKFLSNPIFLKKILCTHRPKPSPS